MQVPNRLILPYTVKYYCNLFAIFLTFRALFQGISSIITSQSKCKLATQEPHKSLIHNVFRGKRGIRTPDTLLAYTRFPGVPLKPLEHLSLSVLLSVVHQSNKFVSACKIISFPFISRIKSHLFCFCELFFPIFTLSRRRCAACPGMAAAVV